MTETFQSGTKLFVTELDPIAMRKVHAIADSYSYATDFFDVAVSVRLPLGILFHIERWHCNRPRILVSATELLKLTEDRKLLRRWELGCLKAIIQAHKMSRSNALLSPVQAAEIRSSRLEARRVNARFKPLADRYFSTAAVITVTDRLSGRTLSGPTLPNESLTDCESRLKAELSRLVLVDDETAELIDALESARTFNPDPSPESVTIRTDGEYGINVHLEYGSE